MSEQTKWVLDELRQGKIVYSGGKRQHLEDYDDDFEAFEVAEKELIQAFKRFMKLYERINDTTK